MECNAALSKNRILQFAALWIEVEVIIQFCLDHGLLSVLYIGVLLLFFQTEEVSLSGQNKKHCPDLVPDMAHTM